MWWIGVVVGIMALSGCIPPECTWIAVLMLPLPVVTFFALSIDLMKEVLWQFEFYLICGLQVHLLYSVSVVVGWDTRAVFWASCCPSMMVAAFIDAFPSKYRPLFSKMFFSGLGLILACWACMLTFGWSKPIKPSTWSFYELEGNTMSSSVGSIVTLFTFCCRHFFVAWFHPDHFVIIVSEMRTVKESVSAEIVEVDGVLQPTGKYMLGKQKQTTRTWSMRDNEFNMVQDLCRGLGSLTATSNPRQWPSVAKAEDRPLRGKSEEMQDTGQMQAAHTGTLPVIASCSKTPSSGAEPPKAKKTLHVSVQFSSNTCTSSSSVHGTWPSTPGAWSSTTPSNLSIQGSELNEVPELPQSAQQQQMEQHHQLHLSFAAKEDADCLLSDAKAVHEPLQDEAELAEAQAATSTTEVGIRPLTSMMSQLWCACNKVDVPSRSQAAAAGFC